MALLPSRLMTPLRLVVTAALLFGVNAGLPAADATPPPADGVPVAPAMAAQIAQAMPKARNIPATPRKLLVFTKTQGHRHASINEGCEALRQMAAATKAFSVAFSADLADLEADPLAGYDGLLLLNTTQLKLSDSQKKSLLAFVEEKGKGLIGIHAATDNFPKWPEGQRLIGGVFKGHPWRAGDTSAIKVDDPGHPVVAAFAGHGFWIKDELYQIWGPYERSQLRVLLSLDMSRPQNARPAKEIVRTDNDFAVAWVKTQGKGRVFYSSLGHNPEVYAIPAILQHYLDGIQFALGDLTAPSEPSTMVTPAPVAAVAPEAVTLLPMHPATVSTSGAVK